MYAELELKVCTKCEQAKDKKEFSARKARKVGKASWCKLCLNRWRKQHKANNIEKYKQYEFARGLKRNYNLTVDQYNKMLADQNGVCAICKTDGTQFKRGFHVDHDKHTGHVRGILCTRCNPGIGYFEHSTDKLEMAITYLNKFKK